jgi:hypothetical protein
MPRIIALTLMEVIIIFMCECPKFLWLSLDDKTIAIWDSIDDKFKNIILGYTPSSPSPSSFSPRRGKHPITSPNKSPF